MYEGIELSVYEPGNLTQALAPIARRWDPTLLDEHNREGAGSFKIRKDDPVLTEIPSLLDEGNLIRHVLNNGKVFWWEILRKRNVDVSEGEYEGEWVEVSGPGVKNWATHAVVYPEYGLVKNPDDRVFNFAAKQGSWYVANQWVAPVTQQPVSGGAYYVLPKEWPANVSADWVWATAHTTTAPAGDVFFRREFTIPAAGKYRLIASADDYAHLYMDGGRILSITEWGAHQSTFTTDITLDAGNHVLAAKGRNDSGRAGLVFALVAVRPEVKDDKEITNADRVVWSGDGGLKMVAYPATAPGWTIGQILNTLLDEAVARGVQSIGRLSRSFTNAVDSKGVAWGTTTDMVFSLGTTYADVLTQLSDGYVDIWVDGLTLNMALSRGTDRSVAIGTKDPVTFRAGLSVLGAEAESTAEIANVAVVKTAAGLVERVGPAASVTKYGRRESYLTSTSSTASGAAGKLMDQLFTKYAQPRRTPTLNVVPSVGNVPWVDFWVGDWVLAPDDDGGTALIKRRIVSLSVTEDQETGEELYTAEIDTIQQSTEERLARWLQALENGTKQGGVSGTSSSSNGGEFTSTGRNSGTAPLPSGYDAANPTAPTNLVASSDLYQDDSKVRRGRLNLSWAHDGLDETGRTSAPIRYDITYRPSGSSEPWIVTSADESKTAVIAPLRVLKADRATPESYTVAVRAVGRNGRTSGWSQAVDVAMVKDTTAPTQPYFLQTDVTTWLRTVTVRWNGKLTTGAGTVQNDPPADFSHVNVYRATSAAGAGRTRVGKILDGNSLWATDQVAADTAIWFTLTAVDIAGNESPHSIAYSVIPKSNVDAKEILGKLDAATVTLQNVGSEALKDGAILESKLADNAVTLAKVADNTLSLAKLNTAATDRISKGVNDAATAIGAAGVADAKAGTAQTAADKAQAAADAAIASAGQMIPNPSFEQDGTGWEFIPSAQIDTLIPGSGAYDGSKVLRMTAPTGATTLVAQTQLFPVKPGDILNLSAWAKVFGTMPTAGDVSISLQTVNTAGNAGFPTRISLDYTQLSGSFQQIKNLYTVPAGVVQVRFRLRMDGATTPGTIVYFDLAEMRDVTAAKEALAAAVAAQEKADLAFGNAQTALTNAGLAQTSANGKARVLYTTSKPSGTGFAVNDVWFRNPDNKVHMWDGSDWIARPDAAIATAQQAAVDAAAAGSAADAKAVAAQSKANKAETDAAAAATLGTNAGTLAAAMSTVSTMAPPSTAGVAPAAGAIWSQVDPNNLDRVIAYYVANANKTWTERKLQDAIFGNLSAAKITTGEMSAARVNAQEMRAAILLVGKITAGDIVSSTLTSASGVFGTMDASVINAGTLNAARLLASDIRTKFLAAGKITAGDMITGTITAASGIIGSLDIGKVTTGTMSGIFITAKTITADHMIVGLGGNMFPDVNFDDRTSWANDSGITFSSANGVNGAGSMLIPGAGSQIGAYYGTSDASRRTPVVGGKPYRISAMARSLGASPPIGSVSVYARGYKADGTWEFFRLPTEPEGTATPAAKVSNEAAIPGTNVYTEVSGILVAPKDAISVAIGLYVQSSFSGSVRFSSPSIASASDGSLVVFGSITGDHVEAQSVAAKVGQFIEIETSQLKVSTVANIKTAVIDELWTKVIRAKKITTDMMYVAGENLMPDPYFLDATLNAVRTATSGVSLTTDDQSASGVLQFDGHSATPQVINLMAGTDLIKVLPEGIYTYQLNYRYRGVGVAGSTSAARLIVNQYNATGGYLRQTAFAYKTEGPPTGTTWYQLDNTFTAPADCSAIRIYVQVRNEGANGNFEVKNPRVIRMADAALVVDGGIVARHLTVTDEMTVKMLGAYKIKAVNIDTNNLSSDTGFIGSMKTTMLTADVITASMISATGGITSRHTITGATIQTAASGRRIRLNTAGITGFDAAGAVVLSQNTTTGDMIMRGNILSRTVSGNSLWLGADMTESGASGAPAKPGLVFGSATTETQAAALYRDGTYGALRMDSPYSDNTVNVARSVMMASNSGLFGWAWRSGQTAGPGVSGTQKLYIGTTDDWFLGGGKPGALDDGRLSYATDTTLNIRRNASHYFALLSSRGTWLETSRLDISGPVYATAKNFRIPHPTLPGKDLIHGSTESPMAGVEYWGEGQLGNDGMAIVTLPVYFEALTKLQNRAILVTPKGEVDLLAVTDILDGKFTVSGTAGQRFTWLVKAERKGADFEIVADSQDKSGQDVVADQPVQETDDPETVYEPPVIPEPEPEWFPETDTMQGPQLEEKAVEDLDPTIEQTEPEPEGDFHGEA